MHARSEAARTSTRPQPGKSLRWRRAPGVIGLLLLGIGALVSIGQAGITDFSPGLLRYVSSRWGRDAVDRLQHWHRKLEEMRADATAAATPASGERVSVTASNDFWNRVPYEDDSRHWGVDDYWATPVEMLASDAGDCEDYSIGKYFTLKDLGVPIQKLRITYVRARGWDQPHMVLAYYPEPGAEPLILDNLNHTVLPASRRNDLEPVYSFNDEDLFAASGSGRVGKSTQIRLWRDLLEKMDKERRM
jgi:predicted transglutaminase-like cysteine proteinase